MPEVSSETASVESGQTAAQIAEATQNLETMRQQATSRDAASLEKARLGLEGVFEETKPITAQDFSHNYVIATYSKEAADRLSARSERLKSGYRLPNGRTVSETRHNFGQTAYNHKDAEGWSDALIDKGKAMVAAGQGDSDEARKLLKIVNELHDEGEDNEADLVNEGNLLDNFDERPVPARTLEFFQEENQRFAELYAGLGKNQPETTGEGPDAKIIFSSDPEMQQWLETYLSETPPETKADFQKYFQGKHRDLRFVGGISREASRIETDIESTGDEELKRSMRRLADVLSYSLLPQAQDNRQRRFKEARGLMAA